MLVAVIGMTSMLNSLECAAAKIDEVCHCVLVGSRPVCNESIRHRWMGIGSVLAGSEFRSRWPRLCRSRPPSLWQARGRALKSNNCLLVIPLPHIYMGRVALVEACYTRATVS